MSSGKSDIKKETWLEAFNKIMNLIIITALLAIVLGFFFTFGAILAVNIF